MASRSLTIIAAGIRSKFDQGFFNVNEYRHRNPEMGKDHFEYLRPLPGVLEIRAKDTAQEAEGRLFRLP